MNYKQVKAFLIRTLEIDKSIGLDGEKNRMTPMLWGGAGVGKSSVVKEVGFEMGYEVREVRLSTLSPVDVRGVPFVDPNNSEHFKFVPPNFMPTNNEVWTEADFRSKKIIDQKMIGERKPVLLFFDEINTAAPMNQVVAYEISLDRRMGGHPLPPDTLVVMAGNRVQDRGATFEMPLPLANRLVHMELEHNEDIFLEYGLRKNLPEGLLAFIKFKPSMLSMRPDGGSGNGNTYAFPTPRSWENAARFIANNGEKHEVAAVIGDAAAVDLFEFLKLRDVLPDLDAALERGIEFKSEDPGVMYFYSVALSNRLLKRFKESKNEEDSTRLINNFVNSMNNAEQEMQALAITCLRQDNKIVMALAKNRTMFSKIRSVLKQ